MADPIADRMTDAERAEWERLRADGYSMLSQAHAIYMDAAKRTKGEGESKV